MRQILLGSSFLVWLVASCGTPAPTTDRATSGSSKNVDDDEEDDGHDHDHDIDKDEESYLHIRWNAVTDDGVTGYRIYKKVDGEVELVSTVNVGDDDFDEDAPSLSLSESTVELSPGYEFCILVSAIGNSGESEMSEAACL